VSSNNKCGTVYISGSFAFNLQLEFRRAYEELAKKNTLIQIDFHQATYMDSSGLGMLLVMKKYLEGRKMAFELLRVSGQVKDLLTLTHFEKYFKINGQAQNA
jgi:anti-anti-sigma factor